MKFGTCVLSLLLAAAIGCRPADQSGIATHVVAVDGSRDTQLAQRHNAAGTALLRQNDLAAAEQQFVLALKADPFYGPAHNNLGSIYLDQKKLYQAAWEFQHAAKLLPDKAQPQNNLGLVYERVGQYDQALKAYSEAYRIEPENVDVAANMARVLVRMGRKDEQTRRLLRQIVMCDQRPQWVQWARRELALIGPASAPMEIPDGPAPAPAEPATP